MADDQNNDADLVRMENSNYDAKLNSLGFSEEQINTLKSWNSYNMYYIEYLYEDIWDNIRNEENNANLNEEDAIALLEDNKKKIANKVMQELNIMRGERDRNIVSLEERFARLNSEDQPVLQDNPINYEETSVGSLDELVRPRDIGGRKRKTSKRKTSKRKTSKRKTSKRKTSKRKTSKRKTSKRKTSKRKTSKKINIKGGALYGTGIGANCYDPNFSIYNTRELQLFPYKT
jgi:hypothetical protein